MKALAGFVMRGYGQAALVAAALALLSLAIPLIGVLSSAAVALVTLRLGLKPGALVMAFAGLACAAVCWLWLGSPWAALGMFIVLWAPVWGLAGVLRFSRSLALAAQAAGLAGLLLVALAHLTLGDPAAVWNRMLEPVFATLSKEGLIDAAASADLLGEIARWMTGIFVAALLFQVLIGLFIGRWWQALLYNPGGFGADFRAFRLHSAFGILGLILLSVLAFLPGAGAAPDLLIVLIPLWLFQGLAVVHQIRSERGASVGWLVALYLSMVFLMPHAQMLVACVGLVDIWTDIRARLGRRPLG
jgi:hypothetical protein